MEVPKDISGIAQTVDLMSPLVARKKQWWSFQVIYLVLIRQGMSCQHWHYVRSSCGGAKLYLSHCPDSAFLVSHGGKKGAVVRVPSYISVIAQTVNVLSTLVVRKAQS